MSRHVRLLPNVDYKKLPLSPIEGRVFLKIDGKATEAEIAVATGFHPDTVAKAIDRFVDLRAVEVVDKAKEQVEKTTKQASGLAFGGNLGRGDFNRRLLDEPAELDAEKKATILDAEERIQRLNFYELLGLHRLVDKKEIKAAYYAIAPEFHPDKYFKRNLGIYKAKIEAIFARLTLAHDTLSSKQKRAEYDDYLNTHDVSTRATDLAESAAKALADAQAEIERQAQAAAAAAAEAKKQADLTDRKRALAAKLGGGKFNKPGQPGAPAQAPMDPKAAAEALRVRYEYAKQQAAKQQVDSFVTSGRNMLAQGDFAAAANVFRVARTLMPNDPDLVREAEAVARQASFALSDNFARLGDFEIQQERWADAAVNFTKAANGKPEDPRLHERAAFATFKSGSNPRRAVDLARRAVELAPKMVPYRITLAYSFAAAGLESSAAGELARAAETTKDEKVQTMIAAARDMVKSLLAQAHQRAIEERMRSTPAAGMPAASAPPDATPIPAFRPPPAAAVPQQSAPAQQPYPPQQQLPQAQAAQQQQPHHQPQHLPQQHHQLPQQQAPQQHQQQVLQPQHAYALPQQAQQSWGYAQQQPQQVLAQQAYPQQGYAPPQHPVPGHSQPAPSPSFGPPPQGHGAQQQQPGQPYPVQNPGFGSYPPQAQSAQPYQQPVAMGQPVGQPQVIQPSYPPHPSAAPYPNGISHPPQPPANAPVAAPVPSYPPTGGPPQTRASGAYSVVDPNNIDRKKR